MQINREVNVGHFVTWGALVLSIGTAWGVYSSTVTEITKKIDGMETTMRSQTIAHDSRIRAVEIAQASQSSDLRAIQSSLTRIEAAVERLQPKP